MKLAPMTLFGMLLMLFSACAGVDKFMVAADPNASFAEKQATLQRLNTHGSLTVGAPEAETSAWLAKPWGKPQVTTTNEGTEYFYKRANFGKGTRPAKLIYKNGKLVEGYDMSTATPTRLDLGP